jgi:hypothetical protein
MILVRTDNPYLRVEHHNSHLFALTTAVFDDPVTNDAGDLKGFLDELEDTSLLGTYNIF